LNIIIKDIQRNLNKRYEKDIVEISDKEIGNMGNMEGSSLLRN